MTDAITKRWIRNESDELAVRNGCRFDEAVGQRVVDWWAANLRLYEGAAWAGKPFVAQDWQYECTMRMYGWVKHSERWSEILGYPTDVRRFKQATIWVPKKNKKSPTLAANALYLLCADGEKGQKVFLAARDGMQARDIVGLHVIKMVEQSPVLSQECHVLKHTCKVTHIPTGSVLIPVASHDAETQKAKEGINGSVLVDELHVVDRRFMRRVSRAGISRMQPFQIEVSTAGNDPDSYAKQRYDYGKEVLAGRIEDDRLFVAVYEAAQDLKDEDLAASPLAVGEASNPAWGHTIDPDEFVSDYRGSCGNLADLADFKQYRLNIWQQSANPWLDYSRWLGCADSELKLESFSGLECHIGLDLSRTEDMTAAVVVTQVDETILCYPLFWIPRRVAQAKSHITPLLEWADNGWLELTDGDVIDYDVIEAKIGQLSKTLSIANLVYDKCYAEDVTQRLENNWGVPRAHFPQTITAFAPVCAELERRILSQTIAHPNSAVLNWQAGHVTVRTDVNQNRRPVKPKREDHKKIDGIVALLMGLAGYLEEPEESVYKDRGLRVM